MVEKFGPPASTRVSNYTTGTGATITGEELAWIWSGATTRLTERCDKVTESCLSVRSKEGNDVWRDRIHSDRAKAKKAF